MDVLVTDEMWGVKEHNHVLYEYHATELRGLNVLSDVERNPAATVAVNAKLRQLNRERGTGWTLYYLIPGNPIPGSGSEVIWPTAVFQKPRRPGQALS